MAAIAARRDFFEDLVIADIDLDRAGRAADRIDDPRVTATKVDASSVADVLTLARHVRADVVVNACDPRFNPPIFDAAREAGATYIDMAMHLSEPHPTDPYNEVGTILGAEQLASHDDWAQRGQLALVGMGVEPGLSDVFARYAADHLFARIDTLGVRDGSNLVIDGMGFAPTFSIWTTIEECLNPPLVYEREPGLFTTEPFSEPEVFDFPAGIGPVTCVNVEHEEVILMPRWIDVDRVTFKYGLGEEFIDVLRTLHKLGLDRTRPVDVRGTAVSPRDLVAACLPNPAELGDRMTGLTCAGTLVDGLGVDHLPRSTYLYQVVDNAWTMAEYGHQSVVWQTALNPVVAMELLAGGGWNGVGVLGPEAFDPVPYLGLLAEYGAGWCLDERQTLRAVA